MIISITSSVTLKFWNESQLSPQTCAQYFAAPDEAALAMVFCLYALNAANQNEFAAQI